MAIALEEFTSLQIFGIWFFLLFIAVLGIVFNGIIIYLYASSKELRTPMNILFVNLTVSDLMVSLFGTFVSGVYSLTKTIMQQGVCDVYGFVTYLGGTADAWALTFIAFERYLTVARPFGVGGTSNGRVTVFLIITWAIALIISSMPLIGLSAYTHEAAGFWCSIDWEYKNYTNDIFVYIIFIVSYFTPIGLIIFAYAVVVMKISAVAKTGASESSMKAQKQVTNQSILMVVGFIVAWTPYALVCLTVTLGNENPFSPKVAVLPSMFSKFSFVVNPFIYVALNKQFRAAFVKKILNGKDPFKKDDAGKDDNSYNATMGKTEGQTATKDGAATNKVAPAPEA